MTVRESIPDKHNGAYLKQYDKAMRKESMRAAVNSKCLDCTCWESTEVRQCPATDCPLYQYRPYQPSVKRSGDGDSQQLKSPQAP
jgi:hypothetical protein